MGILRSAGAFGDDDDDVYYYIRWRLKLEGETENNRDDDVDNRETDFSKSAHLMLASVAGTAKVELETVPDSEVE